MVSLKSVYRGTQAKREETSPSLRNRHCYGSFAYKYFVLDVCVRELREVCRSCSKRACPQLCDGTVGGRCWATIRDLLSTDSLHSRCCREARCLVVRVIGERGLGGALICWAISGQLPFCCISVNNRLGNGLLPVIVCWSTATPQFSSEWQSLSELASVPLPSLFRFSALPGDTLPGPFCGSPCKSHCDLA